MGVLNLWKVLSPISELVDLSELSNKTLAVDLSIWICENSINPGKFSSQAAGGPNAIPNPRPHLRALFFRCKSLLEIGCKLIFVREGDVLDLKQDTMKKRNQNRFGSSQSQSQSCDSGASVSKPIKKRNKFDSVADECCEMLKYMGINVIRSPCGEAEKACAYLNMIGRCDGVITDDSDVLLYGARTVYKNFSLDNKKSEMTIEAYSMERVEKELGYNREMLVALALLLGCDYDPKGVPGVGKEVACKFLNEIVASDDTNVLNVIRNWKHDIDEQPKYTRKVFKQISLSPEHSATFPNEEIIKEYLTYSKLAQVLMSDDKYLKIRWERPILAEMQSFNQNRQSWPIDYTTTKMIPLIIKYESDMIKDVDKRDLKPLRIIATRRRAFKEYYEVVWHKMVSNFDTDLSSLVEYITLEPVQRFQHDYPQLVQEFESGKEKKKSTTKKVGQRKQKKQESEKQIDDEAESERDEDPSESEPTTSQSQQTQEPTEELEFMLTRKLSIVDLLEESTVESNEEPEDLIVLEDDTLVDSTGIDKQLSHQSDDESVVILSDDEEPPVKKHSPEPKQIESLPDLPFSQRMKKLYENATIFN